MDLLCTIDRTFNPVMFELRFYLSVFLNGSFTIAVGCIYN